MRYTGTTTLLYADKLDTIVDFYRDVLGWAVHGEWRDEDMLNWVLLGPADEPSVRLMYNRPEHGAVGQIEAQQAIPWIHVDDVRAAYDAVRERGGEVGVLEDVGDGRSEFSVTDPQGYRLYISGPS